MIAAELLGRVAARLRSLVLSHPQQLLGPVAEAVLGGLRFGTARLRAHPAQLGLGGLGVLGRDAPLALDLGQLHAQPVDLLLALNHVLVDLATLVAAQRSVEVLPAGLWSGSRRRAACGNCHGLHPPGVGEILIALASRQHLEKSGAIVTADVYCALLGVGCCTHHLTPSGMTVAHERVQDAELIRPARAG